MNDQPDGPPKTNDKKAPAIGYRLWIAVGIVLIAIALAVWKHSG